MADSQRQGDPQYQAGRYPSELAGDVETTGGLTVHLRPIRPDDGGRLQEFHERLSPQSVYRRFFFMHLRLSVPETERFTHVDYVDRLALVVEYGGRLVAVGRYERLPDSADAEVAFVVADELQHQGIGTMLLEHLADAALKNGDSVLWATKVKDAEQYVAQAQAAAQAATTTTTAAGAPPT